MINAVYRDALKMRDDARSILKGERFEKIVEEARKNWVEYEPQKKQATIAGIDSSYNSTKFQGLELWVVAAISVGSDGATITENHRQALASPPPSLRRRRQGWRSMPAASPWTRQTS